MREADGTKLEASATPVETSHSAHGLTGALVQIVSSSRINALVVSKIVERSGLKCFSSGPSDAWDSFGERTPCIVILDGGLNNLECADVLDQLLLSGSAARAKPAIVFLSARNLTEDEEADLGPPDAVIAKPITPESLQPTLRHLSERTASLQR